MIPEYFKIHGEPKGNEGAVIQGDCYRFTLLTERLIRLEYNEKGIFENHATQVVYNRSFPVPRFQVSDRKGILTIRTEYLELVYRKGPFDENSLEITIGGAFSNHDNTWHFGHKINTLKGTCRTLDQTWGAVELEEGLISRIGYSVMDDSSSAVILADGRVKPRESQGIDMYYFGYGHQYQECLKDYFALTGKVPLVPKYALGNWWSRYYPYSQEEYRNLMRKFEEERIPLSVAVLDMDWHLTKIPSRYGRGWTGYTWNETLFPDHKNLLDWLHEHKMKVTLNLHPADGVKAHESAYAEMAERLGIDPGTEEPIPFDLSNEEFLMAYFECLHHPLEAEGVDFWWIDWQSGTVSSMKGADPLWMLNHYHSLDICREGKRGMILSRYSGPGSHRYPLGFSGDTRMTWDNLRFQPYFTAAAANIGYTWWSHDIGGHARGIRDDELMARWVQFGVFSPVNRLHSNACNFNGKEPWNYKTADIIRGFMQLRHKMIPYLYSMNYLTAEHGQPLLRPMYYLNPEDEEAYNSPNEYWFGTELVVCPITEKNNPIYDRGKASVWLPPGRWTDVFTGHVYSGKQRLMMFRDLHSIPVLAKEGAIVPLDEGSDDWKCLENPKSLCIHVFAGADNRFSLYEDDGMAEPGTVFTDMHLAWTRQRAVFTVKAARGDLFVIPARRNYKLYMRGFSCTSNVLVKINGRQIETWIDRESPYGICIILEDVPVTEDICVETTAEEIACGNGNYLENCRNFLLQSQTDIMEKEKIMNILEQNHPGINLAAQLIGVGIQEELLAILLEMMSE